MKTSYKSEEDLFVVRACLDLLTRDKNTEYAKQLKDQYGWQGEQPPLLNFIDILFDVIAVNDFNFYKEFLARY